MVAFCSVANVCLGSLERINGFLQRLWFPVIWFFQFGQLPICFVEVSSKERTAVPFTPDLAIHADRALAIEKARPFRGVGTLVGVVPDKKQIGQKLRPFSLCGGHDPPFVFALRHGCGNSERNVFSFPLRRRLFAYRRTPGASSKMRLIVDSSSRHISANT